MTLTDTPPTLRRLCRAAFAAVIGLPLLSSCAPEPAAPPGESEFRPVQISVNSSSIEQRILGEMYQRTLRSHDRDAYLTLETASNDNQRIERLNERRADLVVGCTGELLHQLNPVAAEELSREYTTALESGEVDKNSGKWREKVYSAMVGSLPGNMMATDPSNALGCADYDGPELPQNIVPVYRKPMLNRRDRLILNSVGGTISTADIRELTRDAMKSNSVSVAVVPYLQAEGL
ncbi:hypothetical protein M0E87_07480 [Corynebacterium sp. CCM 9185]|uniref:ABC transporter substrate-binding protein n=1 Tax=Corynebacterium marambiense TaxID=2765364 RepID=A0ABS0VXT2_9CORY|nr:hypothetical protein [Corynebacterium marambiense]MBI9000147.1 hypothetical protein [Corynebacterium marambiense]MCK7663501.1 hypothetical protein [Corynebacterium marambiense]MCX7542065.1 hypothetical protein [Corynebacterium marambiense]